MEKKYSELCATLTELKYTPEDKVFLISFLKGKLRALYLQLESKGYQIDEDLLEEVKAFI